MRCRENFFSSETKFRNQCFGFFYGDVPFTAVFPFLELEDDSGSKSPALFAMESASRY